jgi:hypothetical protein
MQNKTFLKTHEEILQFAHLATKKGKLVADSGGTKTDWALQIEEQTYFFTTESYHPSTLDLPSKKILLDFWKQISETFELEIHFFGAGCSSEENQVKIKDHFTQNTLFKSFEVASDLVAAGIALLGNEEGYVGILGTGSVLTYYQDKQITEIIGGFGYLLGDEGSGYYFGKLVLQKYLNNELSEALKTLFSSTYGTRKQLLSQCYGKEGKSFISSIQLHSENTTIQEEIDRIHTENIQLFLSTYLPKDAKINEISFVGSYAFYQQKLLKITLEKMDWKLRKVIQKPILALAERVTGEMSNE